MRRFRTWTLAVGAVRAQLPGDVARIGVPNGPTGLSGDQRNRPDIGTMLAEGDCPLVRR